MKIKIIDFGLKKIIFLFAHTPMMPALMFLCPMTIH